MSGEVLAAAAAAAARSLDELLLSHGAEGRSSGNLKYPLKQQKAHSLVLTQIIQPGTRSRKTRERGREVPLPPPSGTVRLHVSYFTPPEMRCNFPSPFQQSPVNTVCGETRASPAFPQSRAGAGEPGRGAGAGHRTPCRGRQKQKPPDGAVALAAAVALPGPQTLLPAGWESLPRVPFVARQAAVAARGAHGQPHAAASAEDFPAAAAERRGRGATAQAAETPRRAGCGGTEVTWERGRRAARAAPAAQQVPAARSSRAAPARPLRARERAKSAGALARACAVGRRRARYLPAPSRDAAGARLAAGVPGSVGKARGWALRVLGPLRTLKGIHNSHGPRENVV
ncbi:uncharacterized protein LOC119704971 isoform X2 [Motacilla alba alba]|uniref:uncharacterized protein LOC119704971 isoform X2 n=1 Tax=Motacilla alba alba TaxID=1094192 RepID=UPI0018D53174|nr:uncharacterized protein LOC119704971 isoform X2 [Motacilla alba alba]